MMMMAMAMAVMLLVVAAVSSAVALLPIPQRHDLQLPALLPTEYGPPPPTC